jgi:hypothetical protein
MEDIPMKAKQIPTILAGIALCITLASCSALLNPKSIFSSLDKPDTGRIAGLTGTALLDALAAQNGSQTFYDALTVSQKTAITTQLTTLGSSTDPATASKAGLALADMTVKTDPVVHDVVNSISNLLINSTSTSTSDLNGIVSSLTTALDPIKNDPADLAAFLTNMSTISTAYSHVTTGTDVTAGDLQTYMVAAVFSTVTDVFHAANLTTDEAATALGSFLNDTTASLDTTLLSGTSVTPTDLQTKLTGSASTTVTTLDTLANLAGLGTLANKITSALTAPTI